MFADTAKIFVKSGKGGDGHVSFRRELYVPAGGPDGGDGGKGGDIIFEVDSGLNTLEDFRHKRKYTAEPGREGGGKRMHGRSGRDLVIRVPEGTILREDESGKIIADMSGENRRLLLLRGGKGGLGNMHFATPAMQAPKYAQPGQDSRELWLRLELRVIADVGLLGFPNAGKSSLLSMCSNARPEIANYHFTTLTPQLGVVGLKGDRSFVMADIPGLIEGASEGVGLGYQFLRHIERCRVLIHVVDLAGTEGRDPAEDIETLRRELRSYDEHLLERPMLIAANKVDLLSAEEERERLDILREKYGDRMEVCPISAAANTGIGELLEEAWRLLERAGRERRVYESEFDLSSIGNEELLPLEYGNPKPGFFTVEGPKIEKMLGYTNLESEKGFAFFQRFMEEQGIIKRLKRMGLKEGDSIRIYGHEFEYLDSEGDDFPASEKEEE
ncbi:Obg family GTPase CgtA [Oribacterium sp. oral taxon 078 str. F0263]|uniref:GTPase ObgE n=1 Tax=Oribacterium sp. oral taxon 078 TaxID=652706 RepID=UPI0003ADF82F|nr:GTPase ObgE [Oribacterium sp. oral taxon 078]ERL05884.1 Obg family GTPase CgtA [Oribacterium sp. oral taxon 078 str. F0263]